MKSHSTTILTVRHRGMVALGGDGQVTLGTTVMKADAISSTPNAKLTNRMGTPYTRRDGKGVTPPWRAAQAYIRRLQIPSPKRAGK